MDSKRCAACGKVKPSTEFYRNKKNRDGLLHQCKPCHDDYCRRGQAGSLVVPLAPGRRAVLKPPYRLTPGEAETLARVIGALAGDDSTTNRGD